MPWERKGASCRPHLAPCLAKLIVINEMAKSTANGGRHVHKCKHSSTRLMLFVWRIRREKQIRRQESPPTKGRRPGVGLHLKKTTASPDAYPIAAPVDWKPVRDSAWDSCGAYCFRWSCCWCFRPCREQAGCPRPKRSRQGPKSHSRPARINRSVFSSPQSNHA